MVQVRDLTELTIGDLWSQVKDEDEWWGEIKELSMRGVKRLLESAMEEELLEELHAGRYRRTELRRGYRNGYRYRGLLTEMGPVEHIRVPRDRDGTYRTKVLPRYQRRQKRVNRMVREMFLSGVSTRRVQDVIEPLLGEGVSAQTVSRICRSLPRHVGAAVPRPAAAGLLPIPVAGRDRTQGKGSGWSQQAAGPVSFRGRIRYDGVRELVDFRQAKSESEAQWLAFIHNLYERGLRGANLSMVTTDRCVGLHNALDTAYPYVARQRCWAHKLRNVAAKLPRRIQEPCLAGAKTIYKAPTRREAVIRFRQWAAMWREQAPNAVRCIEEDMDELLPFLDCPTQHRRKVRTTNAIERAFREVRRRTRPMSCFQNSASVDRIIFGVISHLNANWKDKPLPQFTHNS